MPVIASVGGSSIGRSDLRGRDLFRVALPEAFDELPNPADYANVAICDSAELPIHEPTAPEREAALD